MQKDIERTKYQIIEGVCSFTSSIIRREKQVADLPLQPEVANPHLIKYLKYYDEIDEFFRDKIVDYLVASSNWVLRYRYGLTEKGEIFDYKYPQYVIDRNLFQEWLTQKEGPWEPTPLSQRSKEKVKVAEIFKKIIKEKMPEYKFDKSLRSELGMPTFSKEWLNNNKIFIAYDRGTLRKFMSIFIGLKDPLCNFDLAEFFGAAQSGYEFYTNEQLIKNINRALDLIDKLLPHFEKILVKALREIGVREIGVKP